MFRQQCAMFEIATSLVFIHPRHDVSATGHANRSCVVVAIKNHALACQFVHLGSLDLWCSITTHGIGALVICQQKNNVRPSGRNGRVGNRFISNKWARRTHQDQRAKSECEFWGHGFQCFQREIVYLGRSLRLVGLVAQSSCNRSFGSDRDGHTVGEGEFQRFREVRTRSSLADATSGLLEDGRCW